MTSQRITSEVYFPSVSLQLYTFCGLSASQVKVMLHLRPVMYPYTLTITLYKIVTLLQVDLRVVWNAFLKSIKIGKHSVVSHSYVIMTFPVY